MLQLSLVERNSVFLFNHSFLSFLVSRFLLFSKAFVDDVFSRSSILSIKSLPSTYCLISTESGLRGLRWVHRQLPSSPLTSVYVSSIHKLHHVCSIHSTMSAFFSDCPHATLSALFCYPYFLQLWSAFARQSWQRWRTGNWSRLLLRIANLTMLWFLSHNNRSEGRWHCAFSTCLSKHFIWFFPFWLSLHW